MPAQPLRKQMVPTCGWPVVAVPYCKQCSTALRTPVTKPHKTVPNREPKLGAPCKVLAKVQGMNQTHSNLYSDSNPQSLASQTLDCPELIWPLDPMERRLAEKALTAGVCHLEQCSDLPQQRLLASWHKAWRRVMMLLLESSECRGCFALLHY